MSLIRIISPEDIVPALKNTLFLRNARTVVARLLGVEEIHLLSGWHVFFKPAGGSELLASGRRVSCLAVCWREYVDEPRPGDP